MLPLAGVAAGAMLGGVLIDRILSRTGSKWLSRSLVAAAALVLAGLGPLLAIKAVHPAAALAALGLGAAISGLAAPATWAATMDVGGKSATSIMAIINMSGNLGAYACPKAVGKILDAYPERWGSRAHHVRDGIDCGRNLLATRESRPSGGIIDVMVGRCRLGFETRRAHTVGHVVSAGFENSASISIGAGLVQPLSTYVVTRAVFDPRR